MNRLYTKMKTACLTAVSRRGVCRLSNVSDVQSLNKNRLHFLQLIILCVSVAFFTGCAMVSGERKADGALIVTSWRLLWKSEAINFSVTDSNLTARLAVGNSTTDDQALAIAAEAAVKAALKSIAPIP